MIGPSLDHARKYARPLKKLYRVLRGEDQLFAVLKHNGWCPTCEKDVTFVAHNHWFRDYLYCSNCRSIPRERALMLCIEQHVPDWRNLTIHESSPGKRGTSKRLSEECVGYIPSQYYPDKMPGSVVGGFRCENLEKLTFADNSIDLHITQDVMEHVFDPAKAFAEIARTLKPGGMHIFTVPIPNKSNPSVVRARRVGRSIENLETPVYHGNPIGNGRSLVTVDWGFDIVDHIRDACGLDTDIITLDDLSKGIRAEFIDVLVTRKPKTASTIK